MRAFDRLSSVRESMTDLLGIEVIPTYHRRTAGDIFLIRERIVVTCPLNAVRTIHM